MFLNSTLDNEYRCLVTNTKTAHGRAGVIYAEFDDPASGIVNLCVYFIWSAVALGVLAISAEILLVLTHGLNLNFILGTAVSVFVAGTAAKQIAKFARKSGRIIEKDSVLYFSMGRRRIPLDTLSPVLAVTTLSVEYLSLGIGNRSDPQEMYGLWLVLSKSDRSRWMLAEWCEDEAEMLSISTMWSDKLGLHTIEDHFNKKIKVVLRDERKVKEGE